MLTFTGIHITREFGSPSIRDMAVQGMRVGRFAGAWEKYFWPIGMHSMLVADLLPSRLEHHGLLHDVASEVSMNDVPRPMKTAEQKALEKRLAARTYDALGLALPNDEEAELVHLADMKAGHAEGLLGCGPRGYKETTSIQGPVDVAAELLLGSYLSQAKALSPGYYECMMDPDGFWPLRFESRLRSAIRKAQSHISYHEPDITGAEQGNKNYGIYC